MTTALKSPELSPEALALIREGTPTPAVKAVPKELEPVSVSLPAPERESSSPKPARNRTALQREPEEVVPAGQAHLSIRLSAEIPAALLRASLDRKLARIKPWTQQDIVALVLGAWLKREGYLGKADE